MKPLQRISKILFFSKKLSIYKGMLKQKMKRFATYLIFLMMALCLPFSVFSQSRCQDVFRYQWANEIITHPLQTDRVVNYIEELSHQQVLRLFERPIQLIEDLPTGRVLIGPVLIHNYSSFKPEYQQVIRDLYSKSIRESWIRRGANELLEARFDALAELRGVPIKEVREFYQRDPETLSSLFRSELELVRSQGIEVGQVIVEFRDGSRRSSDMLTDYLTDGIWDVTYKLENFLTGLPQKEISSLHLFHTHPALYPSSGATLSYADILLVGQLRNQMLGFRTGTEVEAMDFHMYAIGQSNSQFIIGHYSERGFGFE